MYNREENRMADVESLYFKDKKEIKKAGNTVGILLSVCQGMTFVLGLGVSFILMFGRYVLKTEVLNNVNVLNLINVLLVAVGMLLPTVITIFLCREKLTNILRAERPKKGLFLGSVLLAFGANALCNISSSIVKAVLSLFGLPVTEMPQNNGGGVENYFVSVLCIAVFAVFSIRTARVARSSFYSIGACTAASILVIQTILNALGTVDVLPLTGVTFPFLSNGGTSMIGAWGLLAFVKAADTRQNASFAVRLSKQGRDADE